MPAATRKKELKTIDGTPEKRIFLSIISDYDLKTGLNELIDNALDLWTLNKRKRDLRIDVLLDPARQIVSVKDNAGGVSENDLRLLIAPGATRNLPEQEVIGIFGVGGKRAAVALGELVEIKTRRRGSKSLQLDINNEWLSSDDWHLAAYEIPQIALGTTVVEISKLRQSFDANDVEAIRAGLGETYSWFLCQGCQLFLNAEAILPLTFDTAWAYPADHEPRHLDLDIEPSEDTTLAVSLTAGLIRDRDPQAENYGVYVFCNNRLIVKELRSRDVGYFVTGEAGVPHPDASLCRAIVQYQGPAKVMPWNSSKSGVNFSHPSFVLIRPALISLVSHFSSLSRRFRHDWPNSVFRHSQGQIHAVSAAEVRPDSKIVLPKLPRVRKPPHIVTLKSRNSAVLNRKPWTLGLVEAMGLVDLIVKTKLETKNRAALVLLDSNFEVALKEFIVHRKDLFPARRFGTARLAQLFRNRTDVINVVAAHVSISATLLAKVDHYYGLRNKLIHERATVGITGAEIDDYREVIEKVLRTLFDLRFPVA